MGRKHREKQPLTPRRVLKLSHRLFACGIGLLVLALLCTQLSGRLLAPGVVFLGAGIAAGAAGILLCIVHLRCPRCEASLMQEGGRIPSRLPDFCPSCGAPLDGEDD